MRPHSASLRKGQKMELRCNVCGSKAIMVAGRPICTQCNVTEGEELVKEVETFIKRPHKKTNS